ncbi:major facilitator superfamily transporter [Stemphylium lycopersici]|uniref:Major facilitator superfamily transporter n=1 Tax=Stemphylium lycopersici TaxID=183478 RepID=A0A364N9B4_STELY|nr:major facilitator superfamily transporter [Stemphylium lycopersici]RAR13777.1 major facilitator superfamily transporter [Stemphylium lycopersici]
MVSDPEMTTTIPPQAQHTSLSPKDMSATINTMPLSMLPQAFQEEKEARPATSSSSGASKSLSPYQKRSPLRILAAFIALNLSIFLVALDTVLIPTALPTIAQSFQIHDSLYAWAGSAYLLANAASIPFWGKLSDVFGRKPILLTANFVFLVGSIICAVSISAQMLVAGRTIQGLGGGGVVVLVHVCVSDLFSIRDRSFYIGIVGAVWALASALGPVLGGIFAQELSWEWCFYINIPIVTTSIIVLYFTLQLHDPKTPLLGGLASIDWLGTFIIITAAVLLLVGLQVGSIGSYTSPLVITFIIFGSLAFIAFPFSQWLESKRGGNPIMPLRIFKDISNLSALGVCACDALVFNSVAYFLPLYFQIVLGRSPTITGLLMLSVAVPLAIVSFVSGHVIETTGCFLEVLQAGLFVMTLGVGLLISFDTTHDLAKIIGILIVVGIGFGPNFGAPLIALQTRIQDCDIATGTAAFGFIRMVSGAIGLVLGQVIFQHLIASKFDTFLDIGISKDFASALAGGGAISQGVDIGQLSDSQVVIVRQGFMKALQGAWILYTVIGAVGLLISFGIKRTKLHQESASLVVPEEVDVQQSEKAWWTHSISHAEKPSQQSPPQTWQESSHWLPRGNNLVNATTAS